MKLGVIVQHVSGHCSVNQCFLSGKDFQGHGVKGQGHRATATEVS